MNNLDNSKSLIQTFIGAASGDVTSLEVLKQYQEYVSERRDAVNVTEDPKKSEDGLISISMSALDIWEGALADIEFIEWNNYPVNITRSVIAIMAFSNDCSENVPSEYFNVDLILQYLSEVSMFENNPLSLEDQYILALRLVNYNPLSAALLAHFSFRSVARNNDTCIDPRLTFPVIPDSSQVSMVSINNSVVNIDKNCNSSGDKLGDTYHFWAQYSAALIFELFNEDHVLLSSVYSTLFRYAPELTYLIRQKMFGKTQQFGLHKDVDKQARIIGKKVAVNLKHKLKRKQSIDDRNTYYDSSQSF